MNILIGALHVAFISFLAYRLSVKAHGLKKVYWSSFLLKLLAGLALGWIYTYYYSVGDTFSFFTDGTKLAAAARRDLGEYISFLWSGNETSPIWKNMLLVEPRSMFLSKLVSMLCLLTNDNYWISSLYFSGVSFFSAWYLFNVLVRVFPGQRVAAAIAFLFFPTVVFWSSGIIKESVAAAGLFFLTAVFLQIWFGEKVGLVKILLSLFALWMIWRLKYYFAAVFIPVVFTSVVVKFLLIPILKIKKWEIVLWLGTLIIPLAVASFLHPNFYPERLLHVIVENYEAFNRISSPQDRIYFYNLEATGSSVAINAPWALISGMLRPFIWEAGNPLQFMVAMENTAILVLLVALVWRRKKGGIPRTESNRLLITAVCVYVVLLCVFITLSTPNFGTLSRYRIGFLPFALFVIMCDNPILRPVKNWLQ